MENTFNIILDHGERSYSKDDILNCYRLQRQLLIEYNIIVNLKDVIELWKYYSGLLESNWLEFPKDDEEVLSNILGNKLFKEDYNSLYDFFEYRD
ncbi:hypothetical protein [Paenimyroides ceti]